MIYTFYVTIGATTTQVYPLNFLETSLVDEQEGENVFYRRKFNGTLLFCNLNGGNDYNLLYAANPCAKIVFEVKRATVSYWVGKFSTSEANTNIDKCTIEVTPLPDDDYEAIFDLADDQYDILTFDTNKTTTAYVENKTDVTFTRCKRIMPVIEGLCDAVMNGATVSSTFFTAATNPATLTPNQLLHVLIAQKSDIIRPLSTSGATKAMMSFNELMDILWAMFQIRWTYASGVFTVEHISFFVGGAGLDLRTGLISEYSNQFTYIKDKMPKFERFNFMESSDSNFTPKAIWYDSECINQDAESNDKNLTVPVTTDLEYIITDPLEISDEGFVLLANELILGAYYVKLTNGEYNDHVKLNGTLSWANLHNSYFRHNRVLIQGYMNNVLTTFWSAQKTKKQPINAIVCPADGYDPMDVITTEFGETYLSGMKGKVERSELAPTGEMNFSLLYGVADNVNTGVADNPNKILIYQDQDLLAATLTNPADMNITIVLQVTDCSNNPEANINWVIASGERYDQLPIIHKKIVSVNTSSGDWTIDFQYDLDYVCA